MDPATPRQLDIVALAKFEGRVAVDDLAAHFEVTPQTIRKDLNELTDRGILQRYHGGAVIASGVTNVHYEARRQIAPEEKQHIGALAADLIPDNASLFINIGTTTEQVAMALRRRKHLMVVTNNINVVSILYGCEGIEVAIAGGMVRPVDGAVIGEATVEFIRQFKTDFAIVGTSAIDEDGTLLDYDYREVKVAKAILENARCGILVADSSKYNRKAPVRIGHISELDYFVTDQEPPEALLNVCNESGVAVKIAG